MIAALLKELAKVSGSRFASFTYTATSGRTKPETARYNVLLGGITEEAYKADIATLTALLPSLDGVNLQAAQEVLTSLENSLRDGIGNNEAYTQKDVAYTKIDGMPGVYIHPNGTLSIRCRVQSKTILEAGEYKVVKSSAKTIAKRKIEKGLRKSEFRTFNLSELSGARLNGNTLELN
jgi:hypothetical protein